VGFRGEDVEGAAVEVETRGSWDRDGERVRVGAPKYRCDSEKKGYIRAEF
jgi:hypothetical protein